MIIFYANLNSMPFAITSHDHVMPSLDTRPIAALVAQAPEHSMVAKLKDIAARAEDIVQKHRLGVRAKMQNTMAALSSAELDGWYVDCAPLGLSISRVHKEDSAATAKLMKAIRELVHTAHVARVPGANTLHSYEKKIRNALAGWFNDLDDFAHDLNEVKRRMEARKEIAPMTRAGLAYQRAIKEVLQLDIEPQTQFDLAGEAHMWFVVPLPSDIRYDRNMRRSVERQIHSNVESSDKHLVGLVALKYELQTNAET